MAMPKDAPGLEFINALREVIGLDPILQSGNQYTSKRRMTNGNTEQECIPSTTSTGKVL